MTSLNGSEGCAVRLSPRRSVPSRRLTTPIKTAKGSLCL